MVDDRSPEGQPAAPPPTLLQRILGTFTSPVQVFQSLKSHARWLDVVLISVIAGAILYIPTKPYIDQVSVDRAVEAIEKREGLSEEQKQEALERQQAIFQSPAVAAISYASMVVVPVVMFLFWGLVLWIAFGFMVGGDLTYRQSLAAAGHLSLILLVGSLVKLPLILARKSVYVATSLALASPDPDPDSLIYNALDTFDVFILWTMAVMAVGMAPLAGIRSGKSWGVTIAIFALILVLRVGFASLGGMFGS